MFQPFPWQGPRLIVIISVGKSRVGRIGCSVKVSSLDTEAALLRRDQSLGSHSWLLRQLVGKPWDGLSEERQEPPWGLRMSEWCSGGTQERARQDEARHQ